MFASFWTSLTDLFSSFMASLMLLIANLAQQLGIGG